jgi:hypothetical protein
LKRKTGPVVWRVTIRYFDHKEGLQEQNFTVETPGVDGLAATRLALEMLETDRHTFGASGPINTLELYCALTSDV